MRYDVNATVSFAAWATVEADTPEAAWDEARQLEARDFEYDPSTGRVNFNVTPLVSEVAE